MTVSGTVFIVDDNDDFRDSVAWMLKGEGYRTVAFACPKKAINALKLTETQELHNCCLLLDVRMPVLSGFDFHELLNKEAIPVPVIYMTGHGDVSLAVKAMKKGAVTMLEKPLNPEQLTLAIEASLAELPESKPADSIIGVTDSDKNEFIQLLKTLTPREEQVLGGIVNGNANKVIASDLDISVRTVEVHRARLMKKLKVRSASVLTKMIMLCQAE